jgi:hypothetical protein
VSLPSRGGPERLTFARRLNATAKSNFIQPQPKLCGSARSAGDAQPIDTTSYFQSRGAAQGPPSSDPRVKTASVLVDSNVRPWGRSGQADEMNAGRTSRNECVRFCARKNRFWASVRQVRRSLGPHSIQKAHHFWQDNRCERGHNLNTISLLSTGSIKKDG